MADNSDTSAPKTWGKPFAPGQSGNPGGKNKEREALRKAMLSDCQEMIDIIKSLARGAESDKVRCDAAKYYVDQCIGRAVMAITGEDGAPLSVSIGPELVEALKKMGDK